MGSMNFVGTLISGYLTGRADPGKRLACDDTVRGGSLLLLPLVTDLGLGGLTVCAVLFGLDDIATVPPTIALGADVFGRRNVGTIYGWVICAHQLGAAAAAYLGGAVHDALGDYPEAYLAAGLLAVLSGLMALRIDRSPLAESKVAPAGAST